MSNSAKDQHQFLSPPPSWLRSLIIIIAVYLAYLLWSTFIRARRELKAASWILDERRKAGIPDSDKRPFKIAKAAVEANRSSSSHLKFDSHQSLNPRAGFSPSAPSHSQSHRLPSLINNSPSQHLSPSTSRTHHSIINSSPQTIPLKHRHLPRSSSKISQTISDQSASPLKPSSQAMQLERSNQKRVASTCIDAEDVDESSTEMAELAVRNRKKAKTRPDDLSDKRSSADQGGLAQKKPKAPPSADCPEAQERVSNDSHHAADANQADRVNRRKKRILSECSSEMDADHTLPTKKGRSDHPDSMAANDEDPEEGRANDDLMQVDDEGEDSSDADESSGDEEKSDEDVYMIASDGQKKKLVKIRPSSPELDELQDENTLEKRWVTRSEFRDLKLRGMLHLANTRWDNSSRASTDTANSTLNSPPSSARTPSKQTPRAEAEHGPIWNIESKPGSRTTLSASKVPSQQLHSGSRPRNSLGRMRLSLPPDATSPIPRPRSQLFSQLGNH